MVQNAKINQNIKISQIGPQQNGFNIYVKILKINSCESKTKQGYIISIYDCLVGDETGVIELRLLGQEYTQLAKLNQVLYIKNGRSEIINQRQRLELDKWSKLTQESSDKILFVNEDLNLSSLNYLQVYQNQNGNFIIH